MQNEKPFSDNVGAGRNLIARKRFPRREFHDIGYFKIGGIVEQFAHFAFSGQDDDVFACGFLQKMDQQGFGGIPKSFHEKGGFFCDLLAKLMKSRAI
jgi:hypothetical protein